MSVTTENKTYAQTPYRHKFSNEFTELILIFVRNHKYDNKSDFNQSWEEFVDYNDEQIAKERTILKQNGYNGDLNEKMYKSARFYYLKKVLKEASKTNHKPIKKRIISTNINQDVIKKKKVYIKISEVFNDYIDKYIIKMVSDNVNKPSDCYESFCNSHIEEIKLEINLLIEKGFNSYKIPEKIKKTFKNRFFALQKRDFRIEDI